jgi:integrase
MARKKRGHGEGSIYQRKDGRWAASLTLEDHKRRTFYGKTRKEVQEKLKAALHEQQQGTLATGPQQLLKTYLEKWVEQVYRPRVKASSYQQAIAIIRVHLVPAFGHIAVQKLTAERVQEVYAQKLKDGLAPRTILSVHSILRQALENAVRWNLVSRNVAKLVTLPRPERYEAKTLTVEQAKRLLKVARGSGLETLLLMAVTTGMRRGELLALHWDDIDFENKVVYVQRTISRITGQGVKETEPKTRTSKRKIVVPDEVLVSLYTHRERQERDREKAGVKWRDRGLVFCSKQGDYMVEFWYTHVVFHKLLEKAGLPRIRFHDLRHSMATILLAANVHPKVVQERLGHSNMAITMDVYSHVLAPIQQEAARKLDEMFRDK